MNKRLIWWTAGVLCLVIGLISGLLGGAGASLAQDDGGAEDAPQPTLFVTEDGAFGALLPEGWVASGDRESGLLAGNGSAALQALEAGEALTSEMAGLRVLAVPEDPETIFADLELPADAPLEDALPGVVDRVLGTEEAPLEIDAAAALEFAGRTAAQAPVTIGERSTVVMLYTIAPDRLGLVIVEGVSSLEDADPQAFNVLASVGYSLPLEETSSGGPFTVDYPEDWTVQEGDSAIQLTNARRVRSPGELESGQVLIVVSGLDIYPVQPEADLATLARQIGTQTVGTDYDLSQTITATVQDQEIALVTFAGPQGAQAPEGGLIVAQTAAGPVVAIYNAPANQGYQAGQTALNILLSAR